MIRRFAWLPGLVLAAACSSAPDVPEAAEDLPEESAPPTTSLPVPPEAWQDVYAAAQQEPDSAAPGEAAVPSGAAAGTNATIPSPFPSEGAPAAATYADLVLRMEEIAARGSPDNTDALRLATMYILQDNCLRAEEILGRLPEGDRNDWRTLTEAYVYHMLGEPERAHERVNRIQQLWRRGGNLRVEKAVLATAVEGFNKYTPRPEGPFFVQRERRLLIYVELRDFVCKEEEGEYTIRLQWNWELVNSQGQAMPVPRWVRPEEERRGRFAYRGPVQDFYLWIQLDLPTNLAVGIYRVRMTMRDLHADGPDATVEIPFTVAGD